MAKSKYADARYRLINRELKKRDWIKTSELKEKIENELSINISVRQLEKDLDAMKHEKLLGFYAPIEYDKTNKAYCYTDKTFSIEKFTLRDDEIMALKFYAASLNQYRDYGLFKDFSNALQKIVEAVSIKSHINTAANSRLIVQTDNHSTGKGIEYLGQIASAIDKRNKIQFKYKKFGEVESKQRIFSPYLLKEYKNRWYIIGKLEGAAHITTFALDNRVASLITTEQTFEKDSSFDHNKYFKYSFGITRPDQTPKKITLLFNEQQGNYIKSRAIHHSQVIISDSKKGLKIKIEVVPSYELYEFLLGQGSTVKVIAPKSVAAEIKSEQKKALANYSK